MNYIKKYIIGSKDKYRTEEDPKSNCECNYHKRIRSKKMDIPAQQYPEAAYTPPPNGGDGYAVDNGIYPHSTEMVPQCDNKKRGKYRSLVDSIKGRHVAVRGAKFSFDEIIFKL